MRLCHFCSWINKSWLIARVIIIFYCFKECCFFSQFGIWLLQPILQLERPDTASMWNGESCSTTLSRSSKFAQQYWVTNERNATELLFCKAWFKQRITVNCRDFLGNIMQIIFVHIAFRKTRPIKALCSLSVSFLL